MMRRLGTLRSRRLATLIAGRVGTLIFEEVMQAIRGLP